MTRKSHTNRYGYVEPSVNRWMFTGLLSLMAGILLTLAIISWLVTDKSTSHQPKPGVTTTTLCITIMGHNIPPGLYCRVES